MVETILKLRDWTKQGVKWYAEYLCRFFSFWTYMHIHTYIHICQLVMSTIWIFDNSYLDTNGRTPMPLTLSYRLSLKYWRTRKTALSVTLKTAKKNDQGSMSWSRFWPVFGYFDRFGELIGYYIEINVMLHFKSKSPIFAVFRGKIHPKSKHWSRSQSYYRTMPAL
jgi:hypothetical protein